MKKYIVLLLSLTVLTSATCRASISAGFTENAGEVFRFDSMTTPTIDDSMAYALPDTNIRENPFAFAAVDNTANRFASAGDNYLLVAAARSGKDLLVAVASGVDDMSFMFEDDMILQVFDPLETFNRGMFWFNDKLYFYLMKPIAKGFRLIAPEPVRVAISNVFSNLAAPIRIVNAGLQGKFSTAGNELLRFGTNSTIGIGGMFDPASEHFNLAKKDEDTGQTMGHYGIGPGPYLVLPFLGPSSFRDGLAQLADSQMNILTHLLEDQDYYGSVLLRGINFLSLDKDTYEGVKRDALDPYLFVRDAWTQYRQNLVEN